MFDGTREPDSRSRKSNIKIHEDANGSIYTTGVTSRLVQSEEEVGPCLYATVWVVSFYSHTQVYPDCYIVLLAICPAKKQQ